MKRLLPRPPRRLAKNPQAGASASAEVQPTQVGSPVPAGAEPADPGAPPAPTFRNRGRLRRRLRFLRRVRELGFRDLGGLVFDQHKFNRPNDDLVRRKVAALTAVDTELRALEHALAERRDVAELREPGLSACPRCGTLHGSDARFCPACGLALTGARTLATDVGEGPHSGRPALGSGNPGEERPGGTAVTPPAAGNSHGDGVEHRESSTVVARPGADRHMS